MANLNESYEKCKNIDKKKISKSHQDKRDKEKLKPDNKEDSEEIFADFFPKD